MSARIRPEVLALTAYQPGRNPEDHARELGLDRAIKLASNELGYPPLPSVIEAVTRAASTMNRYPDNAGHALTSALAARFDVSPAEVAIGGGSVALCQQLVSAYAGPGDEVLYGWRSFEAYPLLPQVAGASSVRVPLREETYDLAAMASAITPRTRLIFVCNPNNPTGTAVGSPSLEAFLDAVPADCLVVIDEAYREFVGPDIPDGLVLRSGRPNVAVLRTFSKAYGLAGLRVGYAVAAPEVVSALRTVQLPFSISSVAQAAAVASLAAEDELGVRVKECVAERARVTTALRGLGYEIPGSHANFVWLPLRSAALSFGAACEAQGVIVRPFAGDGVRITIGTPAENDALLAAVATFAG